jgi:hypothetical protein
MRVSDDRYNREMRSFHLALKMLRYEARTNTICAWTGFTGERVRNLSKSHRMDKTDLEAGRHRGPSPRQLGHLLCNSGWRSEISAMAGLCRALGLIPTQPMPDARTRLPGIENGERLCYAFEVFREVVPQARLTLEQLVLIVFAIAEGKQWSLGHCTRCRAVILVDHLSVTRHICAYCDKELRAGNAAERGALVETDLDRETAVQQTLF